MPSTTANKALATTLITVTLSIQILLSLCVEQRFERIHHDDDCRSQNNQKQRWKDEKDQREDQLDRRLGCLLFHLLNALRSERVRMRTQCFANAGAELLGLHQHRNQVANRVNIGPVRQVLPRILARAACALFEYHHMQLVAKLGLSMGQF